MSLETSGDQDVRVLPGSHGGSIVSKAITAYSVSPDILLRCYPSRFDIQLDVFKHELDVGDLPRLRPGGLPGSGNGNSVVVGSKSNLNPQVTGGHVARG